MRVSMSPPRTPRRKRPTYRLRASENCYVVTNPDGTVEGVSTTGRIRLTSVYKEPFASLFAEPFDPERFIRAVRDLDPIDRDRIHQLHQRLVAPKAKRGRKRRPA